MPVTGFIIRRLKFSANPCLGFSLEVSVADRIRFTFCCRPKAIM